MKRNWRSTINTQLEIDSDNYTYEIWMVNNEKEIFILGKDSNNVRKNIGYGKSENAITVGSEIKISWINLTERNDYKPAEHHVTVKWVSEDKIIKISGDEDDGQTKSFGTWEAIK